MIVVLQGFGEGVVDDKAHIWLVDAHPKGDGGYNQLQPACKHIIIMMMMIIIIIILVIVMIHRGSS